MKTIEELTDYIEANGIEMSRYFSEEETIPAIIGHNEADGALVYDYEKLVDCFAEYFKKQSNNEGKTDEEYYEEAVEWVNYNTLRSLPYQVDNYINPIVMYPCRDF